MLGLPEQVIRYSLDLSFGWIKEEHFINESENTDLDPMFWSTEMRALYSDHIKLQLRRNRAHKHEHQRS